MTWSYAHPKAELEHFLEMHTTDWGTRDRWSFLLEPSIRNYDKWLKMADLPVGYTPLVGGADHHTRHR